MAYLYGADAAKAGCYMASACGYDSVPADVGTVYAQRLFKDPEVPKEP